MTQPASGQDSIKTVYCVEKIKDLERTNQHPGVERTLVESKACLLVHTQAVGVRFATLHTIVYRVVFLTATYLVIRLPLVYHCSKLFIVRSSSNAILIGLATYVIVPNYKRQYVIGMNGTNS